MELRRRWAPPCCSWPVLASTVADGTRHLPSVDSPCSWFHVIATGHFTPVARPPLLPRNG